ncbi:hypothetical protein EDB85DRAFT_1903009 [Lactarius pseudohatsudake]|nr:hypothetical protein EDB85DRAFT_1903009 [Lactarius pseudohatsudake]
MGLRRLRRAAAPVPMRRVDVGWGASGVGTASLSVATTGLQRLHRAGEAVSTWGGDGGVDVAVATMSRRRRCLGVEAALVWIVIDGGHVEAVAGRSGGHRVETAGCRSHIEVAGGQGVAGASAVWWFRAAAARGSPASVEMRNKKKKKRKKKTYLGGTKCQRDGAATASTQKGEGTGGVEESVEEKVGRLSREFDRGSHATN